MIRKIETGTASVHDSQHFDAVLDPSNTSRDVFADRGYPAKEREEKLKADGFRCYIMTNEHGFEMDITKPISTQIEEAVKDIPGWSQLDQLLSLFTLAFSSAHLQGDILELGSWCGRSAVVLGMAARLTGNTNVRCVDLFPEKNDWYQNADGTYPFAVTIDGRKVEAYGEQTVWAEPYLRDIAPVYERFNGTLDAFNYAIRSNDLTNWAVYDIILRQRQRLCSGDHGARLLVERRL